jgi:mono/diheme cytochrome c family protein
MKAAARTSLMILALVSAFPAYTIADATADTFKARCAPCHGATGAGDTTLGKNLKLRDLGTADVQKQTDDEFATIISKGKGKMPAYERRLSKQQIDDMVKLIRSLKK